MKYNDETKTKIESAVADINVVRDAAELGALLFHWVIAASQACVNWNASVVAMDRARISFLEWQHDEAYEIARQYEIELNEAQRIIGGLHEDLIQCGDLLRNVMAERDEANERATLLGEARDFHERAAKRAEAERDEAIRNSEDDAYEEVVDLRSKLYTEKITNVKLCNQLDMVKVALFEFQKHLYGQRTTSEWRQMMQMFISEMLLNTKLNNGDSVIQEPINYEPDAPKPTPFYPNSVG